MKKFNSKREALESLRKVKVIPNEFDYGTHYNKYNFLNTNILKPGDIFLYEFVNSDLINYPRVGIYLNVIPIEQTVEVEYVDYRRTIEFNTEFERKQNNIINEYLSLFEEQTNINSIVLWDDTLLVYGSWNSLPNWKELKKAYKKTLWFNKTKQDNRDLLINSIIK